MKSTLFYTAGIALGIASVACGDAISACLSWPGMLGYVALSLALAGAALISFALGCCADQQQEQDRRLKRLPSRTGSGRARHARKGA